MSDDARRIQIAQEDRAFISGGFQAAVAAQYAAVGIECLAAATAHTVIKRIAVSLSVANSTVRLYSIPGAFTTGGVLPIMQKGQGLIHAAVNTKMRTSANAVLASIFTGGGASTGPTFRVGAAYKNVELILDCPIILRPDSGIMIVCSVVNQGISGLIEWEELGG